MGLALEFTTLSELSERLRARDISAVEVLEWTLNRVADTEPSVHAFAGIMTDRAQRAAEQADAAREGGQDLGRLQGVPVAVKDLCHTAGFITAAGSKVLEDFVPERDGVVVERLSNAGAVLVGKTVTHEFAYGQNVPPTRNAWDLDCYPGGSSAGSAVAIAVGDVWGTIGTDTGGSIRVPASVNGVVGLKPTHDLVSRKGVVPMSPTLDTVGPLARTVLDCAIVLDAVAEPRHAKPYLELLEAGPGSGDLSGIRIGVERDYYFYSAVDPLVSSAVTAAIEVIRDSGATVVDVVIPNIDLAVPAGLAVLIGDTSEWHQPFLRTRAEDYVLETRAMLELGEMEMATSYARAQKVRSIVQAGFRQTFQDHGLDAIVAPSTPTATMPVEQLSVDLTGSGESALSGFLHHGFPANVVGIPALSVPVGINSQGLPMAMQLVGRPYGEAELFRIGHAYQQQTAWHLQHPGWLD